MVSHNKRDIDINLFLLYVRFVAVFSTRASRPDQAGFEVLSPMQFCRFPMLQESGLIKKNYGLHAVDRIPAFIMIVALKIRKIYIILLKVYNFVITIKTF